ncbi:hypothetical protein NSMS1_50740 [Nostoc sp. MS1]|nr:hypothetical protein NSMS1_50740 [Nostoc sp. MS1]
MSDVMDDIFHFGSLTWNNSGAGSLGSIKKIQVKLEKRIRLDLASFGVKRKNNSQAGIF